MKGLLFAILLVTSVMTSAYSDVAMSVNHERQDIIALEESVDMQAQIKELLQTDDKHAKQVLIELSQINLTPDEVLDIKQLDNGYYQMVFTHDGKCYTAELTRKKYIDSVRDVNGEVIFAAIY